MIAFHKANKGVQKYFANTRVDRSVSYFIEFRVLSQNQFNSLFTVEDVRKTCAEMGKKFTSKRVAQVLEYFVVKEKLKSRKRRIIKKDGTVGNRTINVFSKHTE